MSKIVSTDGLIEWRWRDQTVRVRAWGDGAARVQVFLGPAPWDGMSALLPDAPISRAAVVRAAPDGSSAELATGDLRVEIDEATGNLTFRRADGTELLAEAAGVHPQPSSHRFSPRGGGRYRIDQRFAAYDDEKLFGLGQHPHGFLDNKNTVIDLLQYNGEVSIPFMLSSRGYGFLWNSAALGHVELAANGTRWVADEARSIDYWVVARDTPAGILEAYADATGHSPMLPDWAIGHWQSKLRYRTQDELLAVAREYVRLGVPISVIVADYFHWTHLGDWRFDPQAWPDPAAMVRELDSYGIRLMVSVWPSVNPLSENWDEMRDAGYLISTEFGVPTHHLFPDWGFGDQLQGVSFYDPTNAQARRFVWQKVWQNYGTQGIGMWWLDAAEPEISPEQLPNLRFAAGGGAEVANAYPREHARTFFEGMREQGEDDVVLLERSAWAGSQRYGVVLWSGDIHTDWGTFRRQLTAGLNVGVSGIPWWATDIGGFHGGDPSDDDYRELYVRWFQFGAFSPIFRAHGAREPREDFFVGHTGGPNEVWAYGPEVQAILVEQIRLRERLKPYIAAQFRAASERGVPVMRPYFVEFPDDPVAWEIADSYLFGSDLLVAPVLEPGSRTRRVYLPAGAQWTDAATGDVYGGGSWVTVDAPLERIPLFLRDDALLPITAEDPGPTGTRQEDEL